MGIDTTGFDYASEMVPRDALFVAADEPLLIYPSLAAAKKHLKAIDVRNGVYPAAYGPNGELYRIDDDGSRVFIELAGEPNRPEELRHLLLQYLEAAGCSTIKAATLADLVATAWAIERDFWQEHDPYGERFGTRIPPWGCVGFVVLIAGILYLIFR